MRTDLVALAGLSLLLLAGCGLSSDDPGTASLSATPSATSPTSPAPTASASPSGGTDATLPDDLRTRPAVAAAIADTAERQKVDPAQVVIAAWSPVTWNNGSLGCPRKGRSYTQSLVDGELLLLRTDTGIFQYHAKAGGRFAYCATPSADYSVG